MNQKILATSAVVAFAALFIVSGALFKVDERETAFVLQFGELRKIYDTPGLKIKSPFIQEVLKYDKRLLNANLPVMEVTAGDQKRLVINVFSRYIIRDPVQFFRTVQTIEGADNRLSTIVARSMRRVIGQIPLTSLLSKERDQVMDDILTEVVAASKDFGIDVKDVRIIRADLPKENSKEIFRRMESEREREAKLFLAEGDKAAQEIRSKAEREKTVILAEANRKARELEGHGEAEATKIYANAMNQNPEFYDFYRSLQAYEKALDKDTTFFLSKDNKFFKHF